MLSTIFWALQIALTSCIEEPSDSKVHVVTYDTFNRFINNKHHPLVLMEFYAPWCHHCQNLAPVFREAAKEIAAADSSDFPVPVLFAKYNDGDEYNRQLRGGAEDVFNYTGYPALLLFKSPKHPVANKEHWTRKYEKKKWQFYGGGRETPDDFWDYLSAISKSLDPFAEERKAKPGFYKKGGKHETNRVVDLEPEGELGFNRTILSDPQNVVWIVEFYSDRCPYCNSLAPEVIIAAEAIEKKFGKQVKVAAVNSRVYDEIATQHKVTSWPWVAAFYQGAKVEDMAGLGGSESIVRFATEMHSKAWRANPPVNAFLTVQTGSEISEGSLNTAQELELDSLLKEAVSFNLKSESGAEQLRKKAKDSITSVIEELKEKLKPVHDLKARLKSDL